MKSPLKSQDQDTAKLIPNREKEVVEFKLARPSQSMGTNGSSAEVTTNYVKFTNVPTKDIYMYYAVTENLMPRERKMKLDSLYKHLMDTGHRVYASGNTVISWERNLESTYKIPFGQTFNKETQQEEIFYIEMQLKFRVTRNLSDLANFSKSTSTLTSSDLQELTQICDIMIKFDPSFQRLVRGVGQFSTTNIYKIQGSHLSMLKGMQSHAKVSVTHGLLLNIDAKYHLVFNPLNVVEAFKLCRLRRHQELQSEFKGVKVKILCNTTKRKSATIVGVSDKNARNYVIPETNQSVEAYFKAKGIVLHNPDALLVCTNKKRNTFYPPELLQIEPFQSYGKPVPDINSIRNETCLRPVQRLKHIGNLINDPKFQIDPESGLRAETKLLRIPARFIQPAEVVFKKGNRKTNHQGNVDTRDALFNSPCRIDSYCIVNFGMVPFTVIDRNLISNLKRVSSSHGVTFPHKNAYIECPVDPRDAYSKYEEQVEMSVQDAYKEATKIFGCPPTILICITPSATCGVYNHLKRLTETTPVFPQLVVTQFVLADKFKEQRGRVVVNAQYCSNLLLKMNQKLAWSFGANTSAWRLGYSDLGKFVTNRTMLVGIDVCHGDEMDRRSADSQSVATFVASVDSRFTDYRGVYKHVDGEDTSAVIQEAFKELFEMFRDNPGNGKYPETLIVYRDGLGEGQFNTYASKEINGMRQAALELKFEFKLLFICSIKKHVTRFFSINNKNTTRNGNLVNGLVVDREITGKHFEFYLQSHNGLQGTAIPTRYVVLQDELHMTGDDVQQFTFNMCHVFQRSAAPCSIPNVVKMADLFAERIKRYEKSSTVSGLPIKLHPDLTKRAYYC
eukprot:NODE_599_length_6258_cov_0.597987.p1 type:complete len:845 gc:universal NODE_599_length_6258_cov_0.597987:5837-3303(-)